MEIQLLVPNLANMHLANVPNVDAVLFEVTINQISVIVVESG
jgi:hypothetical protein